MCSQPSIDEADNALNASKMPRLKSDQISKSGSVDGDQLENSKEGRIQCLLQDYQNSFLGPIQLVKKEEKEVGRIKTNVYVDFIRHIGVAAFSAVLFSLMAGQTLLILADWWVARWSSAGEDSQDEMKWVWTLISFTSGSTVITLLAVFAFFALIVRGSTRLHNAMIRRVMRAPLSFFHTNPVGRILNRFSKDSGLQDEDLPFVAADLLAVSKGHHHYCLMSMLAVERHDDHGNVHRSGCRFAVHVGGVSRYLVVLLPSPCALCHDFQGDQAL